MTRLQRLWLTLSLVLLGNAGLRADDAEGLAVQAVQDLGGTVTRERVMIDGRAKDAVTGVDLAHRHTARTITDADLKPLAAFQHLRSLNLRGSKVTAAGLKVLTACKGLRSLDLTSARELQSVKELAGLAQLEELNLAWTSAKGIGELSALKRLRTLDLSRTDILD